MEFDIWLLLSGIGILIFGMHIFEHAIKFLGGKKLKGIIEKYTRGSWSSIATGTRSTALLQSSSLVSLLVLAFTGAGVMQLSNAIGVIIGANVGTTVSSLLIARLGFGNFKISAFALPMLAIGGLSLIFVKDQRKVNRAKLLVGFGLLFLGLDFMKESVDAIKATFDLTAYKDLSLRAFGLLGMIITIIIQSSSAVGVMTLAALSSSIITFPASIAIVMGSNIGTTVTGVIASLGGEKIKRQVAVSQVLFNLISGIIGVVFFWQYIWLTMDFLGYESNPVMGNAILNAIFNLSTALLFGFFLKPFTAFVQKIIPIGTPSDKLLRVETLPNSNGDSSFSQATLFALREDIKVLIDDVFSYNTYLFGLDEKYIYENNFDKKKLLNSPIKWDKNTHKEIYDEAKRKGNIILGYLLTLKSASLPDDSTTIVSSLDSSVHNSFRSLKSIKNIYHDLQDLRNSKNPQTKKLYQTILDHIIDVHRHIAAIIDRDYQVENFEELGMAVDTLSSFHHSFINEITTLASSDKTPEIELSVLINIDHYIHQAAQMLVAAVQFAYLDGEEEKAFERINNN